MPRKAAVKVPPRSLGQIREEIEATLATLAKLRKLLDTAMSVIRARAFQPYVEEMNSRGVLVRKRNPALKDIREYAATAAATEKHLSALRSEENALLKIAPDTTADSWGEFRLETPGKTV